jgi:hypothetical protein
MRRKIIGVLICLVSSISIAFCGASFSGMPQNSYNLANANDGSGYPCSENYRGNNQINQNLNQNALGLSGIGGIGTGAAGAGGFVWIPQNGINIANANGGNNQINQNLNQNALGLSGAGGMGVGSGGFVWIPQNGINIANANGGNNRINQGLNQNGYGV